MIFRRIMKLSTHIGRLYCTNNDNDGKKKIKIHTMKKMMN